MAIPSAAALVDLAQIIDVDRYPIESTGERARRLRTGAKLQFHETGVCIFDGFLRAEAVETVLSNLRADEAYVGTTSSTVSLEPGSNAWPPGDPRRVEELTTVGTLAEDQLPSDSWLRRLHGAPAFQGFIGDIVGSVSNLSETAMHASTDSAFERLSRSSSIASDKSSGRQPRSSADRFFGLSRFCRPVGGLDG
jgi:hypothetical protein